MPLRQQDIPDLLTPKLNQAIIRSISADRWKTYQRAAGFHEDLAHRLYLWNAAVGQSFHFPLQTAEICLRNMVHQALSNLYGPQWAAHPGLIGILSSESRQSIKKVETRHSRMSSTPACTLPLPPTPQIVASLSLGFWVTLLHKRYEQPIWQTQFTTAFPHCTAKETIADIRTNALQIQKIRNRIFHQEPLIKSNLSEDYAAILRLIGWICPQMHEWTRKLSSVPKIIRERPR